MVLAGLHFVKAYHFKFDSYNDYLTLTNKDTRTFAKVIFLMYSCNTGL